ncbi:MAG: tRNA uridine-5-carboxymethylaminomethyl(34) synthesis GTPase MnmE, partial [Candidatus Dadabacteria bacterium]|nr:tRNA uridine-5-carboxymethylaminomethyl(34) synthesis GTPase MnmE [Candidatus Dadabacteria bacterium]NIQ15091.1 tRNA uridine-5-carboxymethylaminomethyl(34) synthesis GTPase MnmE [Candidatus Dadabacteria bacterium]
DLKNKIFSSIIETKENLEASEVVLTNLRQKNSIENSIKYLNLFIELLNNNESPEILAIDLRSSMDSLGEITGEITTEDILGRIFSKFCIGK